MDIANTTLSQLDSELLSTISSNLFHGCNNKNVSSATGPSDVDIALQVIKQVEKYIGPPVLLFGIISNILTLLTLQDPKLKETPYIHLRVLAAADLCALLLIYTETHHDPNVRAWLIFRVHVYYPLSNFAATMGVWIMVILTLERCIFIQFPLWTLFRSNNSSAKVRIALVFLASCIINFPRFLWYKVDKVTICGFNINSTIDNVSTPSVSDRYMVTPYLMGTEFAKIITWMHSVLLNFLPLALLLVFNSFLIYTVRTKHKRQISLGIHNNIETVWTREQTRLTVTLIAIVGFFTVFVLPSAFSHPNIGEALFGGDGPGLKIYQHVTNFLIWLNFTINFLMYTFINVKFMRAFKRMLRRWRRCLHLDRVCSWRRHNRRADTKRQSMFPMVETEENVPFNNNMHSLQPLKGKTKGPQRSSEYSNVTKESTCSLSFKLDNISMGRQSSFIEGN